MQNTYSQELSDKAFETHKRIEDAWKNTDQAQAVADLLPQFQAIKAKYANSAAEKKAEDEYVNAEKYFKPNTYNVCISILEEKILKDPILANTKAGVRANDLLGKAKKAFDQEAVINVITNNLIALTTNPIRTKNYKEAIKIIETDPEYKAHKTNSKKSKLSSSAGKKCSWGAPASGRINP